MKNKKFYFIVGLFASSIMFSSCIGSFPLWHKLLKWNGTVGDKFTNELVFVALHIVPVYEIAGLVDALVLNSVEFWTGSNAIAQAGKTRKVIGNDGKEYTVKYLKDGYKIIKPNGEVVKFTYDKTDSTWNVIGKGKKAELFKINKNGTARITLATGQKMDVALNAQGIATASMAVRSDTYYASR